MIHLRCHAGRGLKVSARMGDKASNRILEKNALGHGPPTVLPHTPSPGPLSDVFQLDAENRGMKVVQAAVEAKAVHGALGGAVASAWATADTEREGW